MSLQLLLTTALIPVIVAVGMKLIHDVRSAGRFICLAIWLQLGLIVWLCYPLFAGSVEILQFSPDFYLSRLDAAFVVLTAGVAAAALSHGHVFFQRELVKAEPPTNPVRVRLNYACSMFFVLAMYSVYLCKNLGFLWVCVETTTLMSAPLVYFSRTKHAVEATWKYVMICSVGISFALLGTLFIFASGQHGAVSGGTLRIGELVAAGARLDPTLLRFGFIFCLLGYGTKAGLFPIHNWLPDAHSEAPAPSSALLSGSLLNCALMAIWRICDIVNASHQMQLMNTIDIWAGTVTVIAASLFLIRQYALKRLFAYSSIENVGIMLFAIGLNSAPLFFFQAVNHSIAKVALFLLSGNIIQATGKKTLTQQSGVIASAPAWGVLVIAGVFAVTGAPPFGSFFSEWLILLRAVELHYYLNAALVLIALSLSFVVVCKHSGKVVFGARDPHLAYFRPIATSLVPALLLLASLCFGLSSASTVWQRL